MIFDMKYEACKVIEVHDYPAEDGAWLLVGNLMWTPTWFRPTIPSNSKSNSMRAYFSYVINDIKQ